MSSPSVTDSTTTLCASPRSKADGQTRLPTFSMNSSAARLARQVVERVSDHVRIEMAAPAGVHLHRLDPGGADAFSVVGGLLVALDHRDRQAVLEIRDGTAEQCGFARSGAGDEIQREGASPGEAAPVFAGVAVVLGEDVALDADDPLLAEARHMDAGKPATGIDEAFGLPKAVVIVMVVIMVAVLVGMIMRMVTLGRPFALDRLVSAAADSAHHANSVWWLLRSSPDVTCISCHPRCASARLIIKRQPQWI